MTQDPLAELHDRLVARCTLIVERHANARRVPRGHGIPSEMRQYVDPIIDRWLETAPPWRAPEVVGCTPDEVREIERAQQTLVPEVFREFLVLMGREAADLDRGIAWLYPDLLRLKESALELLADGDIPFALPDGALVAAIDQGYQFWWLDPADGPDPAVWHWSEGQPPPTEPQDAGWVEYLLRRASYQREPEFTRFADDV